MPKHLQVGARNIRRTVDIAISATPVINTDVADQIFITGLDRAITSMSTGLSGTPNRGDTLWVTITDNGTAHGIAWGAKFENSTNGILPIITIPGVQIDVALSWHVPTAKWRCVAVS
jgi:hypothetical protein